MAQWSCKIGERFRRGQDELVLGAVNVRLCVREKSEKVRDVVRSVHELTRSDTVQP